jgi:hypothetical protein
MHLHAIEVARGEGPVQRVVGEWDEALALVHEASGADGHFETVEINGREYVLVATPFC